MNKPKAPKDMTAPEFVEYFKEKKQVPSYGCNIRDIYNDMVKMLAEPAPNPFTPDQLAVLRELQRCDYKYATRDENGSVWIWETAPKKQPLAWLPFHYGKKQQVRDGFLMRSVSWDDPEPLCFADYAPLDSPCEGGEKE